MFYFEYNGHNTTEYGVAVTTRPNIPVATPRGEYVEVAGRSGSLLVTDGTYENIEIEVEINFVRDEKYWWNTQRIIKNWLKGSGKLKFSDDDDWYYRVKQAYISDNQRKAKIGNELIANFICEPFQYRADGQQYFDVDEVKLNPYYEAQPTYKITGSGTFVLEINDEAVVGIDVDGVTIIDTEMMNAFDENGNLINNKMMGNYEDLWLKNGQNRIAINDDFTLQVKPNWRTL